MTTTPASVDVDCAPAPMLGAGRSRNARLREAMRQGEWTNEGLARAVGVDPKTVDRWINTGRTPHRTTATHVAAVLGADAHHLWPDLHRPATRASHPEVCQVWTRRGDAPLGLWWDLFSTARHEIDLLCRTGAFLHIHLPDLVDLLQAKARTGCTIRITLTDPQRLPGPGPAWDVSGSRGSFDPEDTPALHQMSLGRFASLTGHPRVALRTHHGPIGTDLFRGDEDMLLAHRVPGVPAARSPLWHLVRAHAGLFDTHCGGFDHDWDHAAPYRRSPADTITEQDPGR